VLIWNSGMVMNALRSDYSLDDVLAVAEPDEV
jgi:hypothetical protein